MKRRDNSIGEARRAAHGTRLWGCSLGGRADRSAYCADLDGCVLRDNDDRTREEIAPTQVPEDAGESGELATALRNYYEQEFAARLEAAGYTKGFAGKKINKKGAGTFSIRRACKKVAAPFPPT